ncbi:MAG: hypothetical protein HYY30_13525 [Chloroflexi bacterium]|nr:hypothetical protein [Chloroflexota bacterium]
MSQLGVAATRKDKDFAMQMIGKYTQTSDREVLEETYRICVDKVMPKVPYVPVESMQTILDEIAQQNPKAKDARVENLIDNHWVKELDDSGFIKKLYGE